MTQPPPTNFDRLGEHLQSGSLAARLLGAHLAAGAGDQKAALQTLLAERIAEIRQTHAGTADQ
jgi:hypothetical protein